MEVDYKITVEDERVIIAKRVENIWVELESLPKKRYVLQNVYYNAGEIPYIRELGWVEKLEVMLKTQE